MQYITRNVYDSILNTIGKAPIESGGIIGEKDGVICEFFFDTNADTSKCRYTPSLNELNGVIAMWKRRDIRFVGIVHSHPNMLKKPSLDDGEYAKRLLLKNRSLERLIFPIVTFSSSGTEIVFYEFVEDFKEIEVIII